MKESIAKQISFNQNRNLVAQQEASGFAFTEGIRALIRQVVQNDWTEEKEQELLAYTVSAVLASFYKVNQYYAFDRNAQSALCQVYRQLLAEIKAQEPADYENLAARHYTRLQEWLVQSYPHSVLLYRQQPPVLEQTVVCAEYAASTQLAVLGIEVGDLKEPVLDIGCGRERHLLNYLLARGLDAYGLDREVQPSATTFRDSWLEFSYTPRRWGAIISHLGFTNHFRHQHLLPGGQHLTYAAIYRQVLYSLQKGGRFYYAPGLPFIEELLDPGQFRVDTKAVNGTSFSATVVSRLT